MATTDSSRPAKYWKDLDYYLTDLVLIPKHPGPGPIARPVNLMKIKSGHEVASTTGSDSGHENLSEEGSSIPATENSEHDYDTDGIGLSPDKLLSFLHEGEEETKCDTIALNEANLKTWNDDRKKRTRKNFERFLEEFKERHHEEEDFVRVPPRDPWNDFIEMDVAHTGFAEQLFFHPFQPEITTSVVPASEFIYASLPYTPMCTYYEYQSDFNGNFIDNNNNPVDNKEGLGWEQPYDPQTGRPLRKFNASAVGDSLFWNLISAEEVDTQQGARPKIFIPPPAFFELTRQDSFNSQISGVPFSPEGSFNSQISGVELLRENSFDSKSSKRRPKTKPNKKSLEEFCGFCKNNGQDEALYMSHTVKDAAGRVLCPKLRVYKCPICGEDGDSAHTVKYCPKKKVFTYDDMKLVEKEKNVALKKTLSF